MTTAKHPRLAQPALVPPLPADLRRGLCATGPWPPELWVSDHPADRAQAISVCSRCPVLAECRSWAISMRPVDDLVGILGGWTVSQREAARRARQHSLDAAAGP